MSERTYWRARTLEITAGRESLLHALVHYRFHEDRWRTGPEVANLISSRTDGGHHKPILDLDFPHAYVPSTTPGRGHLYLDVEIPTWRWVVLMIACRVAGVSEFGFVVWSLRRMGNFVRKPGVVKTESEYSAVPEVPPTYYFYDKFGQHSG